MAERSGKGRKKEQREKGGRGSGNRRGKAGEGRPSLYSGLPAASRVVRQSVVAAAARGVEEFCIRWGKHAGAFWQILALLRKWTGPRSCPENYADRGRWLD